MMGGDAHSLSTVSEGSRERSLRAALWNPYLFCLMHNRGAYDMYIFDAKKSGDSDICILHLHCRQIQS